MYVLYTHSIRVKKKMVESSHVFAQRPFFFANVPFWPIVQLLLLLLLSWKSCGSARRLLAPLVSAALRWS
jgi:hypothetical protein